MEDFDLKVFQPYLFLLIGLGSVLLALFKKSSKAILKATGHKAEGIIYALDRCPNQSSDTETSNIKDKVTVRFLTKDQKWITADIRQDFAAFYSKQYQLGETVEVYYDPKDPTSFIVDTKQSEVMARGGFVLIGAIFCVVGLYQLLMT